MSKNIFKLKTPTRPESLVLINYNIGLSRVVLSTRINVPTKLWNVKKSRLKIVVSAFPIAEVNARLDYIDDFVNTEAMKLKLQNRLNKSFLREALEVLFDEKNKVDLLAWLDGYIEAIKAGKRLTAKKRVFEAGSIKTFVSTVLILKEYDKKLNWDGLNFAFYEEWLNWLTLVKKYSPSNIVRHFMRLKGLLNIAVDEGLPVNVAYKKWNIGTEKASELSIALTVEELAELETVELNEHHDRIRDLFLVGCYTGMRFSDYNTIDPNAVQDGYLTAIQIKTKGKVVIPVSVKLAQIFAKYNGNLPTLSNQKFNKQIKKAAANCKLLEKVELLAYTKGAKHIEETKPRHELVSSHTARRTFATLAYERGTPVQYIMAITGHKTEKSFMAYIKTSKEKQAEIFRRYE